MSRNKYTREPIQKIFPREECAAKEKVFRGSPYEKKPWKNLSNMGILKLPLQEKVNTTFPLIREYILSEKVDKQRREIPRELLIDFLKIQETLYKNHIANPYLTEGYMIQNFFEIANAAISYGILREYRFPAFMDSNDYGLDISPNYSLDVSNNGLLSIARLNSDNKNNELFNYPNSTRLFSIVENKYSCTEERYLPIEELVFDAVAAQAVMLKIIETY